MNLSGLSYLQFLIVDAFVAIYLFLRISNTHAWSSINPVHVLRQTSPYRADAIVRMVGFFSCILAIMLFMVRDGIMASMEVQDVDLCRASVYLRQSVLPLDEKQMPDIKRGLELWDIGSAFTFIAMGCVMRNWASVPIRKMLGKDTLLSIAAGQIMLAFGVVSFVVTLIVRYTVSKSAADPSIARSISRLTITVLLFAFWVLLVWILLRVSRILRQTCTRDPSATAAIISANEAVHISPAPMPGIRYLLGMQNLSFMRSTGVLMAVVLFVRIIVFLAFDIGYLTPEKLIQTSIAGSSILAGIGTLTTSLFLVTIVQILFPWPQDVLVRVLGRVAEMDEQSRLEFIGGKHARKAPSAMTMHSSFVSRSTSLNSTASMKSHVATTAAVSPVVYASTPANPTATNQERPYGNEQLAATTNQAAPGSQPLSGNPGEQGFLRRIPYIDRSTRENSFFAQGPWSAQVLPDSAKNSILDPSNGRQSAASPTISQPQQLASLEQLVHANAGAPVVSAEGRQGIKNQSMVNNASLRFSGTEANSSRSIKPGAGQITSAESMPTVNTMGITISNSRASPTTETQLDASPYRMQAIETAGVANSAARGLSLNHAHQSSVVAVDDPLPDPAPLSSRQQTQSFISEEYQYTPATSNMDNAAASPAQAINGTPVYVASPAQKGVDSSTDSTETDGKPGLQNGTGPVLIRKGSIASVRRKGTVERKGSRKRNNKTASAAATAAARDTQEGMLATTASTSVPSSTSTSPTGKFPSTSGTQDSASEDELETSVRVKNTRMSAFCEAPSKLSTTPTSAPLEPLPTNAPTRDSSTISNISWVHKGRQSATDGPPFHSAGTSAHQNAAVPILVAAPTGHSYSSSEVANSPSALPPWVHRQSLSSTMTNPNTDLYSSFASINTIGTTSDGFYTPSSSMAQIGAASAPSNARILSNDSTASLNSSAADIFLPASSQLNLGYADGAGDASTQQTPVGTLPSLAPIPEERPSTAPSSNYSRNNSTGNGAAGMPSQPLTTLRRVETLRKAVATDAPLIESSLAASEGEESTGALISALPLPSHQDTHGRVLL